MQPAQFWEEERGQGAIEYILLAGGIIVAAVVIFVAYKSLMSAPSATLNQSVKLFGEKSANLTAAEMSGV